MGRDGGSYKGDLLFGKPEYFFKRGWTEAIGKNEVICPSGAGHALK
jgi:hypothetical protein